MSEASFTDQFAVEFIRDSLWRPSGSRAAVMVGAGFSRNAHPTSSSAREMPTWTQMAKSLCEILYADASEWILNKALDDANSTSGFLRLAQEYKAVFGQGALDEQIRALVPDMEYDPGDLHKALLELPWTDVLTTNWDTLLERTSREIFNINYNVVRTHSEIPSSTRPRIVKLHGTLPAHEPLIFTEDDYREYPVNQAPFVNLVQQSLMESTLCLVGFSGDDPNFLHWSGWVRDNLGKKAPKIYLVGLLELTPSRRRLLEERNVVPVDLSTLPIATQWAKADRHHHATEWFLRSIGMRKTFDPLEWPYHRPEPINCPDYLGTISGPHELVPRDEPMWQTMDVSREVSNSKVIEELVEIWDWNRHLYPGWCIAPNRIRDRIWNYTVHWISKISEYQIIAHPIDFLFVLEHLLWRLDLALAPHFLEIIGPAEVALSSIDFDKSTVLVTEQQQISMRKIGWPELRLLWARVAFVVVRYRRTSADFLVGREWLEKIKALRINDKDLNNEIAFEEILLSRDSGNMVEVESFLSKWDVSASDSIWSARKAGLQGYLGKLDDVAMTVHSALARTRRNGRRDTTDYAAHSREAWLLWIDDTLQNRIESSSRKLNASAVTGRNRRNVLIAAECDMQNDFGLLINWLHTAISEENRSPIIDFYRRNRKNISFASGLKRHIQLGFQIFQLWDRTALPRALNGTALLGSGIRLSVDALGDTESWICATMATQGAWGSDDDQMKYWTRARIAQLPENEFYELFNLLMSECEYAVDCSKPLYIAQWSGRLQVLFQILARLAVRMTDVYILKILPKVLFWLTTSRVQWDITIQSNIGGLLESILLSASENCLRKYLPDIFSLPLDSGPHFVEAADIFPKDMLFVVSDVSLRDIRWTVVIRNIIDSLKSSIEFSQRGAIKRAMLLNAFSLLNESERNEISDIFWSFDVPTRSWPLNQYFSHWDFFRLPCNYKKHRNSLYVDRFLSLKDGGFPFESIFAISMGFSVSHINSGGIEFSADEIQIIHNAVLEWCEVDYIPGGAKNVRSIGGDGRSRLHDVVIGLLGLISQLDFSKEECQAILRKVQNIFSDCPLALRLLPHIAMKNSHENELIINLIRQSLVSNDEELVKGACGALWLWFEEFRCGRISWLPPDDLLKEIGNIIANRRMPMLSSAIELSVWIIYYFDERIKNIILQDVESGMKFLMEEAKYGGRLSDSSIDIAHLRRWIAALTRAVVRMYNGHPVIFDNWLAVVESDPLIEVRRAASKVGMSQNLIEL